MAEAEAIGGSAKQVYDVSADPNWTVKGGAAKPIYVVGTGDIPSEPFPPTP